MTIAQVRAKVNEAICDQGHLKVVMQDNTTYAGKPDTWSFRNFRYVLMLSGVDIPLPVREIKQIVVTTT